MLGIDPLELRLRNCLPDGEPAVSATGCRYDGGSYARVDPPRARARRLRRASGATAPPPRAGPVRRRRVQPVRRAGRVGGGDRGRHGVSGRRLPRLGLRDRRAGRLGDADDGSAVERPGPCDRARPACGRRARRAPGGRAGRAGRHRGHCVLDRELGKPDRRDRRRLRSAGDGGRAAEAPRDRRERAGGERARSRARGRGGGRPRVADQESHRGRKSRRPPMRRECPRASTRC